MTSLPTEKSSDLKSLDHFSERRASIVSDDESLRNKRIRNAEAAKKCREKKKERDLARLRELETRLIKSENELHLAKKDNERLRGEYANWKNKDDLFTKLVTKLRAHLQKQKEYIVKLEANMMAYKMSSFHSMRSALAPTQHQFLPFSNGANIPNVSIPFLPSVPDMNSVMHSTKLDGLPVSVDESDMLGEQDITDALKFDDFDLDVQTQSQSSSSKAYDAMDFFASC